ncbi:MAG: UDP-glucose 4-epimerase GalE [Polaribacter sp.]|nr:UDP-glucose 4-epimerase GalE [Polaribacter sp.]
MKKKVLVTGGCGYIGSHTVVALIQNNFEVIIIDDLSNSNAQTLNNIKKITGVKPTFCECDLKDIHHVKNVLKYNKNIEATIHFAAYKAVGESVAQPLLYYQNNLVSLINILISQLELGNINFIFSSSATVYGNPKKLPITEENQTERPFSPYGNTKKIAEEILEDLSKVNAESNMISLRYFNPTGAHESGLIGELPTGIPNNLMPYITQTAIGLREKLSVYGNDYPTPDGTPIRDYIHVVDLAKAHVKALKRQLQQKQEKNFETFNLGTGNGYSVLEIIKTFEKVSNKKLNYEIVERRNGDVPSLYANAKLAEQKLSWKANKSLEEMIASSWLWEQKVRPQTL